MTRRRKTGPPAPAQGRAPSYPLDRFSTTDLARWRRQSTCELTYTHKIFFHLEAERALHAAAIHEALARVIPSSRTLEGWTRIVDFQYSLEPLSADGSLKCSGRFNIGADVDPTQFPAFPVLYLADSYDTAYAEKFGMPDAAIQGKLSGHELALRAPASFSHVRVHGQLQQLFDLTTTDSLAEFVRVISRFKMTKELIALARDAGARTPYLIRTADRLRSDLLARNWRLAPSQFGIPANPQVFARLVRNAGFEGLIYPSVHGSGNCIAIFADRLIDDRSFVELADPAPAGLTARRIEGSRTV